MQMDWGANRHDDRVFRRLFIERWTAWREEASGTSRRRGRLREFQPAARDIAGNFSFAFTEASPMFASVN
jgi:hypothetical protein